MFKAAFYSLAGLLLLTIPARAASPVIITEFMANNNNSLSDEDGDKSDWIEIYNRGTNAMDLVGWYLTDTTNNLRKWQFPSTNLAANGYMVVFASNKDRRRTGSPLHTNFRLDDNGEYLALVQSNGTTIATEFRPTFPLQASDVSYGFASDARDVVLVNTGAVARALVPTSDLALAWAELGYPDQNWTSGVTAVGYDRNISGVDYNPLIGLNVEAPMYGSNETAYVRIPFVLTNAAEIDTLTLVMLYDDGFIGYLNGHEMARDNATNGTVWNSGASANRPDATAITPTSFNVTSSRDFLQVGTNVLAFHALNNVVTSSDLLLMPQLLARTRPSDSLALRYFPIPTPGAANNSGVAVLGPLVTEVQHTPSVPQDNEDVVITARIRPTFFPVSSALLRYRVMYSNEVELTLLDDGLHGDGAANDGVFGATIPAGASSPGQMIRWYLSATDISNVVTRVPSFLEPLRSPEYLGTMVAVVETTNLPTLYWFVQNPAAAATTTGTRASLFYLGEFYDNVGINLHGQSSSGFPKKSYDIDFHRGYNFRWAAGQKRVDDLNLLTTYPDKAHVRNILAYEAFRDAGTPYHFVVPVRVHQNGVFWGDTHIVENGDDNYLERLGLDPNGALYKMYNTLSSPATGEKKTRKNENASDLQALINGALLPAGAGRNAYLFDNINVPECINYLAAQAITGNVDCCHKNYYLYRDTEGTGEWQICPWDVDLSYGRVWSSGSTYWDDALYPNTGLQVGNNNTLITAIYGTPDLRQMYFRRLRTLMEELLQPPGTPASQGKYEQRLDQLLAAIAPDAALDLAKWGTWCCTFPGANGQNPPGYNASNIPIPSSYQSMAQAIDYMKTNYFPARRTYLFSNQVVSAGGEIPLAVPANPIINITAVDYSPASSNQAQEYIELKNPNAYAVDISGWRVTGGIDFTFAPGVVIPANGLLYVSPDVRSFRARTTGPRGGLGLFVQGNYHGQLSARGETVQIVDRTGRAVAATNYPGTPSLAQQYLRITELMYHPSPLAGNTNSAEEFEYVELKNIGAVALNLNGVRFTNGITFDFAASAVTNLAPGQSVLVVKNPVTFAARYGSNSFLIAGQYSGSLDNSGERLQLLDAVGEEILDFSYNNSWYPITDGLGFSLVIVNPLAAPDDWNRKENWRPSGRLLGSPGQDDLAPPAFAPVLINEALTRTFNVPDAIELYNPNTNAVNVSGWYLTDDFTTPKKFRIPDNTTISAGGYLVFGESQFNPNPGVPPSFALSSDGDEVYLFGTDTNGNLSGYVHGFDFGAAEEGVSFGRYVTSDGKEHFAAQSALTLTNNNAGPKVGPVIVSEIMYHPLDIGTNDNSADEFVELLNITTNAVPLFDPLQPTNTWRLSGGVDFAFPTNVSLAPGESVLVLNLAPTNAALLATFRANYNLSTNARVFGPYSGKLNNDSDTINLRKPTPPLTNGVMPYALVDQIEYEDSAPWPKAADGLGYSLQRWNAFAYGNDPTNWVAARHTAAAATVTNGTLPQITSQPLSRTLLVGQSNTLIANVAGTGPFTYQWRLNGTNLPGATGLSLQLTSVQPQHAGDYELIVANALGVVFSDKATITVRFPVLIAQPPQTIDVRIAPDPAAAPTTNVTFTVGASSIAPMRFQWRRNGADILDATNSSFTITGVQTNDLAYFSVVVSDDVSTAESTNAWLYPLISPSVTFPENPISQSVAVGATVTLSAQANGWPPPFTFNWLLGAAPRATNVSDEPISFFTFTAPNNVTTVSFRAVVKNRALPSGRFSTFAAITTLADSDGDGIPDVWESAYNFNPSNSVDRLADADSDGMLNWQEYQAGTDPTNALSNLKINSMLWSNGVLRLEFQAMSNKTYAVQQTSSLGATNWQNLATMVGRRVNHTEVIVDPFAVSNRFYRIITPTPP